MSLDFYRFYVGFLLVFTSFTIDSSFSSFLRALVKDPVGIELCKRSCHGRNTTTSCNKHILNETTSGRCCVNKGSVVGLDLSNCTLKIMPTLKAVQTLRWLYLQDNPDLECIGKTFLGSFKGLKNLSEYIVPFESVAKDVSFEWSRRVPHNSHLMRETTESLVIIILCLPWAVFILLMPLGPSKCLKQIHGFPWMIIFLPIAGVTLFLIVLISLHQRKRRREFAAGYVQWQ
ncbi:unnamed protein product [Porites evermanni]|uniref:Uncharacterized protein n=1 Tax=Porites evermanni TaxID=104178 RepID=A0ABN8PP12_9CNID|nr:unnamed protein product [Porites evermanni]